MFGKIVPMWAAFIVYGLLLGGVAYEVGVFFPQGLLMGALLISLGVQECKHRGERRYKLFGMDNRIVYGVEVLLVGLCSFWAYFESKMEGFVAIGTFCVFGALLWIGLHITLIRYGK